MAVVELVNVTKAFGGRRAPVLAVDNVSLRVADGEFMVLLGPSGCGKTTTLRLIAGLEQPTSGSIRFDGKPVNGVSPKDRNVGLVFQNYALYPHLTVQANLAFGLKMRRTPKVEIRRRVGDVAELLRIDDVLGRKPHQLSGGQQQRVALGRAIVRNPGVCLFDEPLANLDAPLRLSMRSELRRLQRELGTTALYVTHDQHEAMVLGQNVAVIADGRIQQIGSPNEVFDRPVNRFVAEFVGTPPMNFLDGRLYAKNGSLTFDFGSGCVRLPLLLPVRRARQAEGPATLGVRPTRVTLSRKPSSNGCVSLTITTVESLGDWMDVTGRLANGGSFVAEIPNSGEFREGDTVFATFDSAGVSVFEAGEFGANLAVDRDDV